MKKKDITIWLVAAVALVAIIMLLCFNTQQVIGNAIKVQAGEKSVFMALTMIIALFFLIFFFLILVVYVYSALALQAIAKRTKTKKPWLAWVPVANIYLMTQIGKLPGWTTFFVLGAFIPTFGPAIIAAFTIALWWRIAEARKYPGWWGLLMVIPLVNFVVMGILAWARK